MNLKTKLFSNTFIISFKKLLIQFDMNGLNVAHSFAASILDVASSEQQSTVCFI